MIGNPLPQDDHGMHTYTSVHTGIKGQMDFACCSLFAPNIISCKFILAS